MTFQNQHSFIKALIWIALLCKYQFALSNSCQVYPSEYVYLDSSVIKSERVSANCRRYPPMPLSVSIHSEDYTHCDGTQLRLTDSDFGSEQYSSSDYYVWNAGSSANQLLFIFPTRVNLTNITLHYYSDNAKGLPSLRFYVVPDTFMVWKAPLGGYGHKDFIPVSPGGEPAGRRKASINFNYTTTKVLMYKSRSDFQFTVSEVEFFKTTLCNEMTTSTPFLSSQPTKNTKSMTSNPPQHQHTANNSYTSKDSPSPKEYTTSQSDSDLSQQSENNLNLLLAGVTVTALTVVVGISVLVVLLLLWRKKRIQKNKMNCNLERQDGLYSTLDRGTKQQIQPHSWDASTELYDQIQLSPSTGQSEPIQSETENDKVNIVVSSTQLDCHNMENPQKMELEKSNSEFATYAVVDKKRKQKLKKEESSKCQDNTPKQDIPLNSEGSVKSAVPVEQDNINNPKYQQGERNEKLEEMYAVVQKKPKKCEEQEENAPPIPSHTTESLYTAVQKPKH